MYLMDIPINFSHGIGLNRKDNKMEQRFRRFDDFGYSYRFSHGDGVYGLELWPNIKNQGYNKMKNIGVKEFTHGTSMYQVFLDAEDYILRNIKDK